jgi:hypothetical protein
MLSVVKPHCELKIALNLQLQLAEEQRQPWTSDTSTQSIESLRKSYTREFRAHNIRSSTCPFCGAFTKSIVYSNTRSDFTTFSRGPDTFIFIEVKIFHPFQIFASKDLAYSLECNTVRGSTQVRVAPRHSITTLSMPGLFVTLSISAIYHYKCHYAECHV